MSCANHFDPHAPSIVNMRRNRSNCAARNTGNIHRPQLGRHVFNEIHRDALTGVPSVDQKMLVHVLPSLIKNSLFKMKQALLF
jgi:hypothetical protein